MSIRLMSEVWDRADASQTSLLVLLAIADFASEEGVCWPSIAVLARRARTSERHVQRVLTDLEATGWVSRNDRKGHSTVYRITPPTPDVEVTRGRHPGHPTPDTQVTPGVTPRSPRTTKEPSPEPSREPTQAARRSRAAEVEPAGFAEFWAAYPRKTGKDAARRAWAKATERAEVRTLLDGVQRYATDPNLPEPQYVPHPATWLNGGRWDDDPLPVRMSSPTATATQPRSAWDRVPTVEQLRAQYEADLARDAAGEARDRPARLEPWLLR